MAAQRSMIVDSPVGRREVDSAGSPVGVVRMEANKSYTGIGEVLQEFINNSNQQAWEKIKAKIDYTYRNLDLALRSLQKETGFSQEIKSRLARGQKLLFKPNLVMPNNIDPQTHGPDSGSTTCTAWPFMAALMRWFHDKLNISYHQMSLGEAATAMTACANLYSLLNQEGKRITTEAVIEGKSGNFYGGWGFYFVRKYLSECHAPDHSDNPMQGYEESVSGTYIPPGHASGKLMVYDLNRTYDDPGKGREVSVPGGVNFQSIILHKVVIGSNPEDSADLQAYPGCIFVNVPKLKVHTITLLTNAIKNLGIGLYPMEAGRESPCKWEYSWPHTRVPAIKAGIPHQVWVGEMDSSTGLPKRDSHGQYMAKKTGGITATMIDIIKAVKSQDILSIHIVDAIEAINLDHTGRLPGSKEPEGLVFAGLDPVATDLLCARYIFSNVPLEEASRIGLDDGAGGHFPQRVPIPRVEGSQIITTMGFDSPLSRDKCFENAERNRLGQRSYYVSGWDSVTESPLISLSGHLGRVSNGTFTDLITNTLYLDVYKFPWDMQRTTLNYMESVDKLTGSTLKREFLDAFDEDGDGLITYEDFGRNGFFKFMLHLGGEALSRTGTEITGFLREPFITQSTLLKYSRESWNPHSHNLFKEYYYGSICVVAFKMSQTENEAPDPFLPGLTWGKGKWPSFQLASYVYLGILAYGAQFPFKIGFPSLYGLAFRYADLTQNGAEFTGLVRSRPEPAAITNYAAALSAGKRKPLDFIFYLPAGYDTLAGSKIPNVEVTDDPMRIFTASFAGGVEIWQK